MKLRKLKYICIFCIPLLVLNQKAKPQDIGVPVNVHYKLLLKIITFDRNLDMRSSDAIGIGIVFQSMYRTSLNVKNQLAEEIETSQIKELNQKPITYLFIDITGENLETAIVQNNINILYFAPIRAVNIEEISELCQKHKILSFSSVPKYCEMGFAVSVEQVGDKPQIVINHTAAKNSGIDFSSQLLRLARLIQ
ncbi:MAG: YfiR family protein [Candidatus Latescibacteria bacterium]|nr:YfiR family protein [Candidatus Latescibacterota bacterium]